MAAGDAPSGIATARPRSSTWPVPPRHGGCSRSVSLAAARRHRVASPGGMGQGRCVRRAASGDARPARRAGPAGLDASRRGHHECARQAWGDHVGANPVDRGKPGSKLHLVTDGQGLPLAAAVTAANTNDSVVLAALLDDVPAARTPSGRRRCRPAKVHADKGYAARHCRAYLRRRGITARIARRGIESSQRLGRHRWRVERALSWLSCYRRLQVRWDRGS